MPDLPPPIPAATLVLMRQRGSGAPQVLMMERPATMAFAAGALVFPGGRIEPQDREDAATLADGSELAALKIGAIRETLEETGVAAGLRRVPPGYGMREALVSGASLASVLAEHGLELALDELVPFARWCPNFKETRRFDATFFLAEAPSDAAEPTAQAGEAVRTFWASAAEVLDEIAAGRAHAIFPTIRNLERLAGFGSFAQARADAERHEMRTITPWVERRGERDFVCIPEDAGYPVTSEPLETARRR